MGWRRSWRHIESLHVSFYESSGLLLAAAVQGNQTLALIVELSGEGETWLDVLRFQLEPGSDGQILVDRTSRTPIKRRRCRS